VDVTACTEGYQAAGRRTTVGIEDEEIIEDFVLVKHDAAVAGRVVDSEGEPRAGVLVWLYEVTELSAKQRFGQHTGRDGRYKFGAVSGTRAYIQASYPWRSPKSSEITVEAGKTHRLPDLVAGRESGWAYSGRVVDGQGNPVRKAWVSLYAENVASRASADGRGEFRITLSSAPGSMVQLFALDRKRRLAGKTLVQDAADGASGVVVRLSNTASVVGCVIDAAGHPIAKAEVYADLRTHWHYIYRVPSPATTDRRGRYRIDGLLPESPGHVHVEASGFAYGRHEIATPAAGHVTETEDIVLPRADAIIAGTVTDHDGKPLPDAEVRCHGPPVGRKSAATNRRGRYRIDGVVEGTELTVRVERRGYYSDLRHGVAAGSTNVDFILTPKTRPTSTRVASVGTPAPEPAISTWLNTQPLELRALRGKVVLLHFWTMYSRPCISSLKQLNSLQKQFPKRLAVVAVHDRAAPADEVMGFVEDNELTFPVAIVKSRKQDGWAGKTFRAYGVKSLPSTFLIDKKGVLRYAHVSDDLEGKVATLVEE